MTQVVLNTAGTGLWSDVAKAVRIVDMQVLWVDDDKEYGELAVYFDDSWDVETDGLIYTDRQFEAELNAFLLAQGLTEVSYSEQGMQGDDYVSCDVDADFIAKWEAKFNTVLA